MSSGLDHVGADAVAGAMPITIVGGGPVGMVLAMYLDLLGVRSMIVNDQPAPRQLPKGSTQNSRTMEHYRRLGLAAELRELGLPLDRRTDVVYFTRYNGWELQRIAMPSEWEKRRQRDTAACTDQVLEPALRCNQMTVERRLYDHICRLGSVHVRFGWRCVGLCDERDGGGVDLELEEIATGRRERHRSSFVAGCDGGQSFVRRQLGIRYGGGPAAQRAYLGGPMVSSYLRAPALHERIIATPGWQYWAVNPEVRSNTVCIDGAAELLFNTRLSHPEEEPDDAMVIRAFHASVGESIPTEVLGHAKWTAGQALVAERFVHGRVGIAGDAAHLFTPTGGFGVNTGIDDAVNLAWKLAALVQGWGGPKLLGSYEAERRPIAHRNTAAASELANSVGAVPVDDAMEERSPAGEAARARAAEFLASFGREFSSLGVQLGARYDGSPIVIDDGTEPPPDDPTVYVPSGVPGGRAPHLWLEEGVSLYDRLGPNFTLLRLGDDAPDVAPLLTAARARGMPITVLDITRPEASELYERPLVLIRPDQHIAWRGDGLGADCPGLLDRVTGW